MCSRCILVSVLGEVIFKSNVTMLCYSLKKVTHLLLIYCCFIQFEEYCIWFCASEMSTCLLTFSLELQCLHSAHTPLHLTPDFYFNMGTGEVSKNTFKSNCSTL